MADVSFDRLLKLHGEFQFEPQAQKVLQPAPEPVEEFEKKPLQYRA